MEIVKKKKERERKINDCLGMRGGSHSPPEPEL